MLGNPAPDISVIIVLTSCSFPFGLTIKGGFDFDESLMRLHEC